MKYSKSLLLSVISGLLLGLAFPEYYLFPLIFIGFIPFFSALESPRGFWKTLFLFYSTFFIFHASTLWWISSWQKETDPFLMAGGLALSFLHPFFFMPPLAAYVYIKRKLGLNKALLAFPFLWTSFELLHSLGDLSYPWMDLGYSAISFLPYAQIADIGGVYIVSFFMVAINAIIYYLIKNSSAGNKIQKLFAINPSAIVREKRIKYLNYYLLAFFLTFPLVYGYLQIHKYNNNGGTSLNIGIIQPNINPWDKWGGSVQEQIRAHFDIEDSLLSAIPEKLDMLLWSETAVHYIGLDFNAYHDWSSFRQRVDYSKVPLLTGFLDMKIYDEKSAPANSKPLKAIPNSRYQSFNSAILFNNDGSEPDIHHKMKLTPFGENIPFADMLPFLGKWFEWGVGISSWTKGDVQKILTLKTNKGDFEVGPIICIESVYPNFVRGFADKGADFLVVITNDAWYDGTFGPRQHYAIAQMRAIENRKYLARCGNTGVSGIISSTGESIKETKPMKRAGFAGELKTNKGKSLYVKFGDWLPYLSLIFSAIMIAISFRKKVESK